MKEKGAIIGLDVHAETISVAVAELDGEVRSLGTILNRGESIGKLVKKLGPVEHPTRQSSQAKMYRTKSLEPSPL